MIDSRKEILIVEDEPAIAEDLADIIESAGYKVSNIAYDYQEAVNSLAIKKPDLILLDINLNSEFTGLDLAKNIIARDQIPFLFITSYADQQTIQEVVELNPLAYLVKPYKDNDIITTLALAFAKLSASEKKFPSREALEKICISGLSKQEYRVLTHLAKAQSNKEIAKEISLSVNTIKSHVGNIMMKLDVNSRLQAIQKINEAF